MGETMKINGQGSKSVRGRNIIRCQQLIIVFLLKQKNCIRQNNNFHSFLSRSNRSPRRVSRVSRFLCVQLSHATNSPRLVAHPRGAIFTRFRRPTFTLICENERTSKLFPWHDLFFLVWKKSRSSGTSNSSLEKHKRLLVIYCLKSSLKKNIHCPSYTRKVS